MSVRSMSPLERALIAAAAALLSASTAHACDIAIIPTTSTLQLAYDPFLPGRAGGEFEFELENRDAADCSVDLVLFDAAKTRIAETELDGLLIGFSSGSADTPLIPTAVPGTWRVAVDGGKRVRLSLAALIIRDTVVRAGQHSVAMALEVHDAGAAAARAAPVPLRLVVTAPPRAQMNIVGAEATFGEGVRLTEVDFGEMVTGTVRRVFLQLRANTGARLLITSANKGRLVHEGGDEAAASIAYAADLNGRMIDLTHAWHDDYDFPGSIAGTSLPFDLRLGTVGAQPAGNYSDTITIEFSAL